MPESDNVKVCVRVRPLNEKEKREGNQKVISVDKVNGNISARNPNANADEPPKIFSFDHVFGDDSKQVDIYNLISRPIVEAVLEGYNGTVFAYGQTGTGKTFTMEGVREKPELRGIIPNSFAHIFGHIAKQEGDTKFLVRVSYLEIYNEEVVDLLGKNHEKHLEVKERPDIGVYVKDLSSVLCHNADDMERIMNLGNRNRSVGATQMNERSSRSHAIFSVTIECSDRGPDGAQRLRAGKLHLVDLAGSERQSKTGATGIRLKEATKINLSLSTLGNVISALVDGKSTHIPYRNSKLTRLLQDSLGGNSKTVMVANVGPADYNYDETISTLRYATRAKSIKNNAHINEDPKDALMRQYEKELAELKKQLGETGLMEEEGDEDDEDVEEFVDENGRTVRIKKLSPEKMEEIQSQIKNELRKVAAIKNIEEAERNKIARKLEKRLEELRKAQDEQRLISEKIQAFERKIIVGGENLLEKAEEQARLLEESEKQLEKQKEKQMQMKQKLTQKEEEKILLEEKYANLNEEAQSKTRKLKKLKNMIIQAQAEINDIKTEHQREMEGLLESVREMSKELKLNMAILDSYIPLEFQEVIEENVFWNEELGEWQLKCVAYSGNNIRKPKQKNVDKNTYRIVDFNHVYLSYTADSAEKAMRDFQRAKSAKEKKKKNSNKNKE